MTSRRVAAVIVFRRKVCGKNEVFWDGRLLYMSYVGKWGHKEYGFSALFGPKYNSRLPRLSEIGHRTLFWPEKEGKVLKRVSQKKKNFPGIRSYI